MFLKTFDSKREQRPRRPGAGPRLGEFLRKTCRVYVKTQTVIVVLALLAALVLTFICALPGGRDSPALVSGGQRTPHGVMLLVLKKLAKPGTPAFCTFECVDDPSVWFQVYGHDLAQANLAWPRSDDPVARMRNLSVPSPEGVRLIDDHAYDAERVITLDCDPATPETWAAFIDAVFREVHGLPSDYRVRGWISWAE
jgi:hypothetical protein